MSEGGRARATAPAPKAAPPAARAHVAGLDPAVGNQAIATLAGGAPMQASVRTDMERAFNDDFSNVRVHTDANAARGAAALGANAYTHGNDIAFAAGRYAPSSTAGRAVLAHELAHVAQQRSSGESAIRRSPERVSEPGDALERSADAAARTVVEGGTVDRAALGAAAPGETIHRQTPAPAGGVNVPPPPPPPATQTATPPPQTMGPEIRQGPIGDIVYALDDWVIWDGTAYSKAWETSIHDAPLIPRIPIPDLGVSVRLDGTAGANALFLATVGPATLKNIHLGVSYAQAILLDPVDVEVLRLAGGTGAVMWAANHQLEDFRALADIEIPAHLSVNIGAFGSLKVAAEALGLFDVATLSAGLSATAGASTDIVYRGHVGLYGGDSKLEFHFGQELTAVINLFFKLVAHVDASLLGFHWGDQWTLASASKSWDWSFGSPLNLAYNNGPNATFNLAEDALNLADLAKALLSGSTETPTIAPLAAPGGGGGGTPGGPGGGGGGGAATAPRGTQSDPIDMLWYKSPGLYPPRIRVGESDYYLTEPDRIAVPDDPGLADVRRNAGSDGKIPIGVSPSSKYYPRIRGTPWPRVAAGTLRTGVKQAQFRRLLAAHGYAWGTQEADHFRDLQWAGSDEYDNLWPLERARNNAANQILNQPVTYTDQTGTVRSNVPLHTTRLGLYFRIVGWA